MGTINYKTSDYVTIGYNCNNIDYDDYDGSQFIIEDCYNDLQHTLKEYYFYYFHVTIKSGYYEGFYIDIENNFSYCFDDYRDKKEAQKEITQIKQFLIDCVKIHGLRSVSPGWITSYATLTRSLININDAIKEMRQDVKITPTWYRLSKNEKYA